MSEFLSNTELNVFNKADTDLCTPAYLMAIILIKDYQLLVEAKKKGNPSQMFIRFKPFALGRIRAINFACVVFAECLLINTLFLN